MARRIAMRNGVRYAYTGKVHDPQGLSTFCHHCVEVVIGRDRYVLTAWHLTDDGSCRFCGTRCADVFKGLPGAWGAKRLPVRVANYSC